MKRAPAFLIATLFATLMVAACSTAGGLGTAADRLDSSAHEFYGVVYTERAPARTAQDALTLAEATRDFNRAVDRSRSRDELRPSFDRVAESYHHLRQQVADREAHHGVAGAAAAFNRLTDAYLDVDRAMNYPATASRY